MFVPRKVQDSLILTSLILVHERGQKEPYSFSEHCWVWSHDVYLTLEWMISHMCVRGLGISPQLCCCKMADTVVSLSNSFHFLLMVVFSLPQLTDKGGAHWELFWMRGVPVPQGSTSAGAGSLLVGRAGCSRFRGRVEYHENETCFPRDRPLLAFHAWWISEFLSLNCFSPKHLPALCESWIHTGGGRPALTNVCEKTKVFQLTRGSGWNNNVVWLLRNEFSFRLFQWKAQSPEQEM